MSRADEAELAAAEYALGLESLGLGVKGAAIYGRFLAQEARPLLLRQQALLEQSIDFEVEDGRWTRVATTPGHDEAVKALDAQLAAVWERCLEALKTLWLTEGRPLEEMHD